MFKTIEAVLEQQTDRIVRIHGFNKEDFDEAIDMEDEEIQAAVNSLCSSEMYTHY